MDREREGGGRREDLGSEEWIMQKVTNCRCRKGEEWKLVGVIRSVLCIVIRKPKEVLGYSVLQCEPEPSICALTRLSLVLLRYVYHFKR